MSTRDELYDLAERVGQKLHAGGWRIATAESCTAGWLAKAITDVPGSSQWFEGGWVTYSNAAKVRDIRVSERTLAAHGAVSEPTVREMAEGALRVSCADVAVSTSGIAGPDGGSPEKPVGTVWFGVAVARRGMQVPRIELMSEVQLFSGDRYAVRWQSVAHALRLVLRLNLP